MVVERDLWGETFVEETIPHFVCPRCTQGRLTLIKDTLKLVQPQYSLDAHGHDAWEPEWITERFLMNLKCSLPKCGEVVCVTGDTITEDSYTKGGEPTWVTILRPKTMFPAPPIISIPKDTPSAIREAISSSFSMFWVERGASASRLRTSVERLMDHFGVVKTRIAKNPKKPNKPGKRVPYDLSIRIAKFSAATKNEVQDKTLHALRVVGNLGTHGSALTPDALLDAFTIYEDALAELIGKRTKTIAKLVKKITITGGRY
jgi:Domain of unknown function (DUF4145)